VQDIIVLGEHTIFIVSTRGELTMQKRLEYHPACCTTYPVPAARVPGAALLMLMLLGLQNVPGRVYSACYASSRLMRIACRNRLGCNPS
jgi:hypothetical protein